MVFGILTFYKWKMYNRFVFNVAFFNVLFILILISMDVN